MARPKQPKPPAAPDPIHYSDLSISAAKPAFGFSTNVFGPRKAPGLLCVYCFNSGTDGSAVAPGGLFNVFAGITVNGASASGHKVGLTGAVNVSGKTANRARDEAYYVGLGGHAQASVNDNGTAGDPVGNLFGGNDVATLQTGATFWNSLVGREITYGAQGGTNVAFKAGFKVVLLSSDSVQGSRADYGYVLGAQGGGAQPGVKIGFAIGSRQGVWPIDPKEGVLLAPDPSPDMTDAKGARPPIAAKGGIDLDGIAFGAFAYRSKGFLVDGEGATSARTLTLKEVAAASIAPPIAGSQTIFLDAADHRLKRKDSAGTITIIG